MALVINHNIILKVPIEIIRSQQSIFEHPLDSELYTPTQMLR